MGGRRGWPQEAGAQSTVERGCGSDELVVKGHRPFTAVGGASAGMERAMEGSRVGGG